MTTALTSGSGPATTALRTAEDLARMPDDQLLHNLVEGAIVEMSRPKPRHGRVAARLIRLLGNHTESQRLGDIITEAGFVLAHNPDTVRGPDVAFVASQRGIGDSDLDEYIEGAPDLAVEIVSPNDNAVDLRELIDLYFAAGARLVWVVYPMFKTVEVYRADDTGIVLRAKDMLDGENVLPGFSAPVSDLFE
jgi:Uma2 family endonuclease